MCTTTGRPLLSLPAYVPISWDSESEGKESSYSSVQEVTGRQLAIAIRATNDLAYRRNLQKLQRMFKQAGGRDDHLVGDILVAVTRAARRVYLSTVTGQEPGFLCRLEPLAALAWPRAAPSRAPSPRYRVRWSSSLDHLFA